MLLGQFPHNFFLISILRGEPLKHIFSILILCSTNCMFLVWSKTETHKRPMAVQVVVQADVAREFDFDISLERFVILT